MIQRPVQQLFSVHPPSRLTAAVARDLQLLIRGWKRHDVYLEGSRLVGGIGQPFAVVGKLRLVLLKTSLHDGQRLLVSELRQGVDVEGIVLTSEIRDIPPVVR